MLPKSFRTCKVLYVEDEPLIAMDGEAMLRDIGFDDIHLALTFADALVILRSSARFDIAIMDINLGNGDTSLPLAEILGMRGTPVIFTSGYNVSPGDVISRFGPRIEKPFDEATLLKAVLSAAERLGPIETAPRCSVPPAGPDATA